MKKLSKRNIFRLIWFCFIIVLFSWQWSTYQAKGVDLSIVESDKFEFHEDVSKISFIHDNTSNLEVIFFPGGLVDPTAYIPLANRIAASGYNLYIIKMPWRMSTKGCKNIKEIFDLSDMKKTYVLGGHSQGGKMAAQFTYENDQLISGLFLLDTSHPRDIDMSKLEIPCLKIYAENDGLASVDEVSQNVNKLPKDTQLELIKGGNHSQFGFMGKLLMDREATISKEEQLQQTADLLLEFLNKIET